MLFTSNTVMAQSYSPKNGEAFFFYPASSSVRNTVHGYDCIYTTDLAYKNEKFKIKPKYRFKADANGLTPYSEIEGHQFTLISMEVENKEEKKLDKKSCIMFLSRDDGEKVFLRIPYKHHPEDNVLTRAMVLQFKTVTGTTNYKINIPCCPIKAFDEDREFLTDKKIIYYPRRGNRQSDTMNLLKKQTDFIGGYMPQGLFNTKGHELKCDSVGFRDVASYIFMQPIAYCKYDDRTVMLPLYEFRGKGNSIYGSGYSLTNFFEKRDDLYNFLLGRNKYHTKIFSMPGKRLRYDGTEYAKLDDSKLQQIRYYRENKQYFIKKQTSYLCEKIDISNEYANHFGLCAVMKDSLDREFQIPLELIDLRDNQNFFTNHKFELEEEYIARVRDYEQRKAAEDAALDRDIEKYTAKYKDKSLAITLAVEKCEDRYLKLRKKYGAKKAGLMVCRRFEIGWGYDEVRESLGKEYFECVHTFENKLGYYERYQYRKYEPTYLTFKNGTLVSISD